MDLLTPPPTTFLLSFLLLGRAAFGAYHVLDRAVPFDTAERQCESRSPDSHLATIHSEDDWAEVLSLCEAYGSCWIGLQCVVEDAGTYASQFSMSLEWIDGSAKDFGFSMNGVGLDDEVWGPGADDGEIDEHRCIAIREEPTNFRWDDVSCDDNEFYPICEDDSTTTTTHPPTKAPTPTTTAYPCSDSLEEDSEALCRMFQFTNIDDRSFVDEDFEAVNYCVWCSAYVECASCDESEEEIISIDLSTMNDGLTGVLDQSRDAAWPSKLKTLDISAPKNARSKLSGEWDWSQFKRMDSLKRLAISYHEFTGDIGFQDWDVIADLEEFECAGCLLEGDLSLLEPDVGDSPLRVLNLWDTPNLYTDDALNVGERGFFSYLPELTHFKLYNSKVNGTFDTLDAISNEHLPNLIDFQIPTNWFYGALTFSSPRTKLPSNLESFHIGYNAFSGEVEWGIFEGLDKLHTLFLMKNSLEGEPDWRVLEDSSLPELRYLDISRNHFEGALPDDLELPRELQQFDISSNKFDGPIEWNVFAPLYNLSVLDLSANNFSGIITWFDFQDTSLEILSLDNNYFDGDINNLASYALPPSLQELHVQNNQLYGDFPWAVLCEDELPNLTTLDMSANKLTGSMSTSVECHFPSTMESITLSDNEFDGAPEWALFGGLYALEHIDLENNHFSGSIDWDVIGDLHQNGVLEDVYLAGNEFEGYVDFSWIDDNARVDIFIDTNVHCDPSVYRLCAISQNDRTKASCSSKTSCEATCDCAIEDVGTCTSGEDYFFDGTPCVVSGDPHFLPWNGHRHDFQGASSDDQYYYVTPCQGSDHIEMPFDIIGKHLAWGESSVSGLEYLTFELHDSNGDAYLLFMSADFQSFTKASTSTLYADQNEAELTAIAPNENTLIGSRFTMFFTQKGSSIDAILSMDGCLVSFWMTGQLTDDEGRYTSHAVVIQPPTCYRCHICGLCGDFQSSDEEMESCYGFSMPYSSGWSGDVAFAYDVNGNTWQTDYRDEHCAVGEEPDDVSEYAPSTPEDFAYVDPCDAEMTELVNDACQEVRDDASECCDMIGGMYCDEMQFSCEVDACAQIGDDTNAELLIDAVTALFVEPVDLACNIPEVADVFDDEQNVPVTPIPTAPSSEPSESPTTPAPTHPGELMCGDHASGDYSGSAVQIEVRMTYDGNMTLDASASDFEIDVIYVYGSDDGIDSIDGISEFDIKGTLLSDVDAQEPSVLNVYDVKGGGDYIFVLEGATDVTAGTFEVTIECTSESPTSSPTNQPTSEPTTAPTQIPTTANPSTNPTTDSPTTNRPTTTSPSASPTSSPTTASPTSAAPTTSAPTTASPTTESPTTSAPTTKEPSLKPTVSPSTSATPQPTHPGEVTCNSHAEGAYSGEPVAIEVRMPYDGDVTVDASYSDFAVTGITALDSSGQPLSNIDVFNANVLTAHDLNANGDYSFVFSGAPNAIGTFQVYIFCSSAAPTETPTTEPTTSSPTTASPTAAVPTTSAPTTASPTTDSPTTSAPTTKEPSLKPTVSPTTRSPSHSDELTCDSHATGAYNGQPIEIEVRMQYDGDLTVDASGSDFAIGAIWGYDADENELTDVDMYASPGSLTAHNLNANGDYSFLLAGADGYVSEGTYDIAIVCSSDSPTPSPTATTDSPTITTTSTTSFSPSDYPIVIPTTSTSTSSTSLTTTTTTTSLPAATYSAATTTISPPAATYFAPTTTTAPTYSAPTTTISPSDYPIVISATTTTSPSDYPIVISATTTTTSPPAATYSAPTTTTAPMHCNGHHSGAYTGDTVRVEVVMAFDGDLTIDAGDSDFSIASIVAYDEQNGDAQLPDTVLSESAVRVHGLTAHGKYYFMLTGAFYTEHGTWSVSVHCHQITPSPTKALHSCKQHFDCAMVQKCEAGVCVERSKDSCARNSDCKEEQMCDDAQKCVEKKPEHEPDYGSLSPSVSPTTMSTSTSSTSSPDIDYGSGCCMANDPKNAVLCSVYGADQAQCLSVFGDGCVWGGSQLNGDGCADLEEVANENGCCAATKLAEKDFAPTCHDTLDKQKCLQFELSAKGCEWRSGEMADCTEAPEKDPKDKKDSDENGEKKDSKDEKAEKDPKDKKDGDENQEKDSTSSTSSPDYGDSKDEKENSGCCVPTNEYASEMAKGICAGQTDCDRCAEFEMRGCAWSADCGEGDQDQQEDKSENDPNNADQNEENGDKKDAEAEKAPKDKKDNDENGEEEEDGKNGCCAQTNRYASEISVTYCTKEIDCDSCDELANFGCEWRKGEDADCDFEEFEGESQLFGGDGEYGLEEDKRRSRSIGSAAEAIDDAEESAFEFPARNPYKSVDEAIDAAEEELDEDGRQSRSVGGDETEEVTPKMFTPPVNPFQNPFKYKGEFMNADEDDDSETDESTFTDGEFEGESQLFGDSEYERTAPTKSMLSVWNAILLTAAAVLLLAIWRCRTAKWGKKYSMTEEDGDEGRPLLRDQMRV